jgi:hypothetical protein
MPFDTANMFAAVPFLLTRWLVQLGESSLRIAVKLGHVSAVRVLMLTGAPNSARAEQQAKRRAAIIANAVKFNHAPAASGHVTAAAKAGSVPRLVRALERGGSTEERDEVRDCGSECFATAV